MAAADLRYRMLGRLEVKLAPDQWVTPGGQLATALAILLANPGKLVETGRLARGLWADPPATSLSQLHKRMSALHKLLERAGRGESLVNERGVGYRLAVADHELDALVFRARLAEAERAAAAGRTEHAEQALRAALALWRAPTPLMGIDSPVLQGTVRDLRRRRLRAAELLLALALARGDDDLVLDQAPRFIDADEADEADPLQERLWAPWLIALFRTGRQVQAFTEYESFEALTAGGPNPLWQLGNALLHGDSVAIDAYQQDLVHGRRSVIGPVGPAVDRVDPLPLPPDLPDLTGRHAETDQAVRALSAPGAAPVLLVGPAGIGKTVLAVHIAHRLRARFPDGVYFLELRGAEPQPPRTDELLAQLLRALGLAAADIPAASADRVTRYQELLAGRRALLVLDDAADAASVADLLPPAPVAALLTSQDRLVELAATRVGLAELDPETAVALFRRVASDGGAVLEGESGDPAGPRRVAEACGGLPLAIRVAGAQRATYQEVPSSVLASWIVQGGLDMLVHGMLSVPAAIAASYQKLDGPARILLRKLALLDLPDLPVWVAAAVFDTTVPAATALVARLVDRSLLTRTGPGPAGQPRYRLHDLVRRYARPLGEQQEDAAAVRQTGYGALLALAEQAHRRACGGDFEIVHGTAPRWPPPAELCDELLADPLTWYEAERANLRAAVIHAAQLGQAELAWDLAISTHEFYAIRGWFDDWHETHTEALAACRAGGNARGEAAMLTALGQVSLVHSHPADPPTPADLERAVTLFIEAGDRHGEAIARRTLGNAHRRVGAFALARRQLAQARERYLDSGDPVGAGQAVRQLGQTCLDLDDPQTAARHLTEALSFAHRAGHHRTALQTTYWLGRALLAQGDTAAASDRFSAVLASAEADGDLTATAYGRFGLGDVAYRAGRWDEAAGLLGEACAAAQRSSNDLLEGRILGSLAALHHDRAQWREAADCLQSAAARFAASEADWLHAQALRALGETHRAAGDPAAARAAWRRALPLLAAAPDAAARLRAELDQLG